MSRAFIKESDVPQPLPEIALSPHPNHTTAAGLQRQQQRLQSLRTPSDATPDALADATAQAMREREIRWLEARIARAQVIDPTQQPRDRVGFGARVALLAERGELLRYRLVGEDEAEAEHGRVSWVSPLAQAVWGARVGESVVWRRPAGDRELEVVAINYDD